MKVVTPEQMREIDRVTIQERGIPGIELMNRAGAAIARGLAELIEPGPVAIVCGKGNNGGDGFVAARCLAHAGYHPIVVPLLGANLKGDAKTAFDALPRDRVTVRQVESETDLRDLLEAMDGVIDAILGTGATPPLRDPVAWAVRAMNASGLPIVAADLPTGLDAETGEARGAIQAARTVTIGLPKLGMLSAQGVQACGNVWVEPIQFPKDLLEDPGMRRNTLLPIEAAALLPERPLDSHKGTFGTVAVCAGSASYPGAATLCALGALRSGVGLVRLHVPDDIRGVVAGLLPEVTWSESGGGAEALSELSTKQLDGLTGIARALVVGPGIGAGVETRAFVAQLLEHFAGPMLLDADALNVLAEERQLLPGLSSRHVLTPHPGEMARLLGTTIEAVQSDRWRTTEDAAARFGCTVLLKGFGTLVAEPGGQIVHLPSGNTALARGGTGDVLSGVIGGLLAQGMTPFDAACLGGFVCGWAADCVVRQRSARGVIVREIAEAIPQAFRELEAVKGRVPSARSSSHGKDTGCPPP